MKKENLEFKFMVLCNGEPIVTCRGDEQRNMFWMGCPNKYVHLFNTKEEAYNLIRNLKINGKKNNDLFSRAGFSLLKVRVR